MGRSSASRGFTNASLHTNPKAVYISARGRCEPAQLLTRNRMKRSVFACALIGTLLLAACVPATALPPTVTPTSAAVTDTPAPTDTTAAPTDTIAAPTDTTAAPTDTAAAPTDTTAAPPDTTAAPTATTA